MIWHSLILLFLATYISWVISGLAGMSIVLCVLGLLMAIVSILGAVASFNNQQDHSKSTLMYVYVYGVLLLIPIIVLAIVCCFSFENTLTRYVLSFLSRCYTLIVYIYLKKRLIFIIYLWFMFQCLWSALCVIAGTRVILINSESCFVLETQRTTSVEPLSSEVCEYLTL